VQLSTTRKILRAELPGLFGVLQMLVMQNSPHRQSRSSWGACSAPPETSCPSQCR